MILGDKISSVLEERRTSNSQPGARDDGHNVVLVIEGGGMRGVVAGGMSVAIEELGYTNAFDHIVGTSAGAMCGAFLLAEQAAMGVGLYLGPLTDDKFIDLSRWRRGPILSLEFLLDELMMNSHPFYWNCVHSSAVRLHPIAIDLETRNVIDLEPICSSSVDGLRESLRASARIPGIAGPPVLLNGHELIDGSLLAGIPFRQALALDPSHMLVLRTRPHGTVYQAPNKITSLLARRWLGRVDPYVAKLHQERPLSYLRDIAALEDLQSSSTPIVQVIAPGANQPEVKQLEKRIDRLLEGAISGAMAVCEGLGSTERYFVNTIKGFDREPDHSD